MCIPLSVFPQIELDLVANRLEMHQSPFQLDNSKRQAQLAGRGMMEPLSMLFRARPNIALLRIEDTARTSSCNEFL
jgi:hypothetical protein